VFKALSALGVCPSAASTRRHAERLITGFDPPQQDRTEGVEEEPGVSFTPSGEKVLCLFTYVCIKWDLKIISPWFVLVWF
jgi:hypothetical protein